MGQGEAMKWRQNAWGRTYECFSSGLGDEVDIAS